MLSLEALQIMTVEEQRMHKVTLEILLTSFKTQIIELFKGTEMKSGDCFYYVTMDFCASAHTDKPTSHLSHVQENHTI